AFGAAHAFFQNHVIPVDPAGRLRCEVYASASLQRHLRRILAGLNEASIQQRCVPLYLRVVDRKYALGGGQPDGARTRRTSSDAQTRRGRKNGHERGDARTMEHCHLLVVLWMKSCRRIKE